MSLMLLLTSYLIDFCKVIVLLYVLLLVYVDGISVCDRKKIEYSVDTGTINVEYNLYCVVLLAHPCSQGELLLYHFVRCPSVC